MDTSWSPFISFTRWPQHQLERISPGIKSITPCFGSLVRGLGTKQIETPSLILQPLVDDIQANEATLRIFACVFALFLPPPQQTLPFIFNLRSFQPPTTTSAAVSYHISDLVSVSTVVLAFPSFLNPNDIMPPGGNMPDRSKVETKMRPAQHTQQQGPPAGLLKALEDTGRVRGSSATPRPPILSPIPSGGKSFHDHINKMNRMSLTDMAGPSNTNFEKRNNVNVSENSEGSGGSASVASLTPKKVSRTHQSFLPMTILTMRSSPPFNNWQRSSNPD